MSWDDAPPTNDEAREICRALLLDRAVPSRMAADRTLRAEVDRRLAAVGFRAGVVGGRLLCVAEGAEDDGYSEPQLAALALIATELLVAPKPGVDRITVQELAARLSRDTGWSKGWIRRAVLGPLERDGWVRVVSPGQRRADEYVQAGPRLGLIDPRSVARSLEALA